ncbi:energy transducer TonB [Mesorhizobium sp. J428]|uniref:energy transducer TonB n=1 Tax=Mesorhizobium sp. J428 TaxID=2898440 RepID=UPI002150E21F|nr:TonB family protein [Mesorhizobium sp. J428]MCR5858985.1 TonB family protein [Mesorhizobium sp. J428]
MIQWPSILPAKTDGTVPEPVALPVETASGADRFRFEFPRLAPDGESAGEASSDIAAPGAEVATPLARTRWNAAALAVSLVFHAVAVAGLGMLVWHEGVEAETDAISVEIVADPAPEPSEEPSVAGDASEMLDAAAPADRPEPGAEDVEKQADLAEASVAETQEPPSADPVVPAPLPQFQPLPPLTEMDIDQPVPGAAVALESDAEADLAAVTPDVSPSSQPAGSPGEAAATRRDVVDKPAPDAPPEAGETNDASAAVPVLAARPSLESMLPAIAVPEQPLFPAAAMPEPPAPAQAKQADAPKIARSAPVETNRKPPAKAAPTQKKAEPTRSAKAQDQPRKTDTKPAARADKPERRERGTAAPTGGAKARDKARPASQAGSVASAAASSGDREAYGLKVNGHVQRYKRYPDAAARGGMKGAVKVSISIGGSGNLASARVTASSGYPVLDSEALATVRRAAPYPKPPASFGGTARFSLTLRYSR